MCFTRLDHLSFVSHFNPAKMRFQSELINFRSYLNFALQLTQRGWTAQTLQYKHKYDIISLWILWHFIVNKMFIHIHMAYTHMHHIQLCTCNTHYTPWLRLVKCIVRTNTGAHKYNSSHTNTTGFQEHALHTEEVFHRCYRRSKAWPERVSEVNADPYKLNIQTALDNLHQQMTAGIWLEQRHIPMLTALSGLQGYRPYSRCDK